MRYTHSQLTRSIEDLFLCQYQFTFATKRSITFNSSEILSQSHFKVDHSFPSGIRVIYFCSSSFFSSFFSVFFFFVFIFVIFAFIVFCFCYFYFYCFLFLLFLLLLFFVLVFAFLFPVSLLISSYHTTLWPSW